MAPAEYVRPNMNFKQYKKLFNPADYVPWEFDSYNPGVSGTLSFFIPGLGQFTDYEYGRAAAFFFGSLVLIITGPILIVSGLGSGNNALTALGAICIAGDLSLRIGNTVDAVKVAKIKNMYEQKLHSLNSNGKISINPVIFRPQIENKLGIGVALTFVF